MLVQLAIPASYYLCRPGSEDERFAWRMFSATRLRTCQLSAREVVAGTEQPIALERELHASWVGALQRGRQPVIDKFLDRHCVHHGVDAVRLVRRCIEVDGRQLPELRYERSCAAAVRAADLSSRARGRASTGP